MSQLTLSIGGGLYWALGWKAPFIFCILVCAFDLVARLLVVEQKDLQKWEVPGDKKVAETDGPVTPPALAPAGRDAADIGPEDPFAMRPSMPHLSTSSLAADSPKGLSPWGVLVALIMSPRGMAGFLITFLFGLSLGALDPTYVLPIFVWVSRSDLMPVASA